MIIRTCIATLLTVFCISMAAFGQDEEEQKKYLYQWSDDKGIVHITDDPAKIPQKYRSRTEKIEQHERTESSVPPQAVPEPASGAGTGPATKIEQTEAYKKGVWQARLREWKEKLADAESRYRALEKQRDEAMQNWGGPSSGRFIAEAEAQQRVQQLEEQMKVVKKEIDEARHQIDDVIPDEARKADIPPGWLREVE